MPYIQGWFNKCKSINVRYFIINLKGINHMIITVDAEMTFDKI